MGPKVIAVGLRSEKVNCENSACSGRLSWIDGSDFVWADWMEREFTGGIQVLWKAVCMNVGPVSLRMVDQWCGHNMWAIAVCEKSCI